MNNTKNYYEINADNFIESTFKCDMSIQYNLLTKHLNKGDSILDVGFGSGRDMLFFKENGYEVYGIDITQKFIENAITLGLNVKQLSVLEIDYKNKFDAIWACASLLHLTKTEVEVALEKLYVALKTNGYMYMSFKLGDFSGERNGRYFTDFTLESFKEVLNKTNFELIESLITKDVRPDREEYWLNLVIKK